MSTAWTQRLLLAGLLAAWAALFHLLGNSSFGYIDTPSLYTWLHAVYQANTDDALGYVILPLVLMLLWVKRDELARLELRPWAGGLVLLGLAVVLHLAGYLVQQARVSVVAFALGLYAVTGLVWGPKWLRATAFPFALMLFLVPLTAFTDGMTLHLRLLSTKLAADFCTGLLGLDIVREGTTVFHTLPDGTKGFEFEVAPACSGIRSLTVVVLLTLVFGYLNFQTAWRRLVLAALALPLALLGNVVRLITVFTVGEKFGEQAGVKVESNLGFATFLVALVGVFLAARWLREPEVAAAEPAVPAPGLAGLSSAPRGILGLAVGAVLLMAASALAISLLAGRQKLGKPGVRISALPLIGEDGRLARSNSVALPGLVPGYQFRAMPMTDLELNYLPQDTVFGRGLYTASDGFAAQVNVVLMGTDRTSIHRPEYCLTGQGWKITERRTLTVPLETGGGGQLTVQRFDGKLTSLVGDRRTETGGVYVFWFVADGQRTASHWERQWWMIRDLVTKGVLQRWAYISFFAPCPPGKEDEAFGRIVRLISATAPRFQQPSGVAAR